MEDQIAPPEQENDDIESGSRLRLETCDDVEPIPVLYVHDNETSPTATSGVGSSDNAARSDHNVIPRMTTLEYMWRRHVRTQTNNVTVQAMLDRILLVLLFFNSMMQAPLNYMVGNTDQTASSNRSKSAQPPLVNRGMVKTRLCSIGYCGSYGPRPKRTPILCFHASKRSSDEYLDILPLLAAQERRVVALDMPGHGLSENPRQSCSIDEIADAFLRVADSLLIETFVCLGSGVGTCIAASLASRYPGRVTACICVNLLYQPATAGSNDNVPAASKPSKSDSLDMKEDGSHLQSLHEKYKMLDPDLHLRAVQTELTYWVNQRSRHAADISMTETDDNYDWEAAARKLKCPTLCVSGEVALARLDAKGMGGTQRFETACRILPRCEVNSLSGPRSTMHMMNQAPQECTSIFTSFLDKHSV